MRFDLPKGFWKSAALLALPIALQNLLTSCASLVDTAMITPLGDTAVAAVGVAGRFTFLLNVVSFGFCSGGATLISQFWGAGDKKGIHKTYGLSLTCSMLFALVFALVLWLAPDFCVSIFGPKPDVHAEAVVYTRILACAVPFIMYSQVTCAALRATEKVSVPFISSLASVVTNTFLNFCLISGHIGFPALGVKGAAIATVTGCVVQAVIVFAFLHFGNNAVKCKISEMFGQTTKAFAAKFFKTSLPVLLNESMWAIGTNIEVMVLARQATEEYAGYSVYEIIQGLLYVFFVGICHAAAILIGKAVGRGDSGDAYRYAKAFFIMTPLIGFVLGALLILVREPILGIFEFGSALSHDTASMLLVVYGIWVGFRMIPYTAICGIFRAGGDTKTGCFIEIGALYLVAIPAVLVSGLVFHIPFVFLVAVMYFAEDFTKGILCIKHFVSKKWIIRLTE